MARYIDADALLERLKKQYGEELGWQCTVNMSDVGMMIEDAPTADVVPKSEVARKIFAEIEEMCVDIFGNFHHVVFAELKKKYIPQYCTDCKHFLGCECFSGMTCDEYEEKNDEKR